MNWIIKNISIISPIVLLFLAGLGFIFKRRIKGDAHLEDQSSIEQAIRLKKLLEAEGMTLKEARQLRDEFRQSRGSLTKAEAQAIVDITAEAENHVTLGSSEIGDEVKFEETTIGMRLKLAAELDVLDSQLNYVVTEFAHECTEARQISLYRAQKSWKAYRTADGRFAALAWEGGSGAPLLQTSRMIELTEQRIKDLRLAQAESNL